MLVVVPLRDDALSKHPLYLIVKHCLTDLVLDHTVHIVFLYEFIRF